MTAFMTKLGLYLAWSSIHPCDAHRGTDFSGHTQVTTPWVCIDNQSPMTKVLNNSPREEENCGGVGMPCFPFIGRELRIPEHGTISFHLSMATVDDQSKLLWIPNAWQRREHMSTIALLLMRLSPYPMCNMGVILSTVDKTET